MVKGFSKTACPKCGTESFSLSYRLPELEDKYQSGAFLQTICKNGHKSIFIVTLNEGGIIFLHEFVEDTNVYEEYIQSPEWKERSRLAKERAGYRCQLCNKKGNDSTLHTHHRTYERLCHEEEMDLIVLCDKHHAMFHGKDK